MGEAALPLWLSERSVGRWSLRRLLRTAGRSSPRRWRTSRHRSRRNRMPQASLLGWTLP